jgi:hypothetical protein
VVAAVVWFTVAHAYSLYDDAYIFFRYADHLVAGCGLRFNCADPPVEGFTSPLWLALLALARLFTRDLESASQLLGALALAGALAITVESATKLGGRWLAPAVTIALALDHHLLLNAVTGLDTALACLAVAGVFRRSLDGKPPIAAALIAILVRPELAVLVLALLIFRAEARRPRSLALIAGALAAMTLVRWICFRDLLPNTFWAKSGGDLRHLRLGLGYSWDVVREFPLIVLAPLAPRAHRWLLVAAGLSFAFFLYSGGDTFAYGRLAAPFVPTLTLLALAGLGRFAAPPALAAAGLALWLHWLPAQHGFDNVARWKLVGEWLAAQNASAATVPIGAIGWVSRAPLVDLVGLTQREVARGGRVPADKLTRAWIGHERSNPSWVLAQKPALIVLTKWRDRPWTLDEARAGFWAEWELLDEIQHGRAPYAVTTAEIAPGVHWLVFRRTAD